MQEASEAPAFDLDPLPMEPVTKDVGDVGEEVEEEEEEEEQGMVDEEAVDDMDFEEEEEEEEEDDEDDDYEEDFEKPAKKASKKKENKKRKYKAIKDEDSDDDVPISELIHSKPPPPATSASSSKRKSPAKKKVKIEKDAKKKEVAPLKLLEVAMKAHKWWEDPPKQGEDKWDTLEHNGVMFPPPYEPHGVKLIYDGKPVDLTPDQEEVATLYAEMPEDGPQLGNPKTRAVFDKNFFNDFREVLGKEHFIRDFKKCNFSNIRAYVLAEREKRKNRTKEEKEAIKAANEKKRMRYAFALVDGHLQKVGNVMVEPPGLFRGRGDHPKTGKLKKRVMPEQVTINIGPDSPVPPCPMAGHSWGAIVHKKEVTWLAYWKENIMQGTKYVWLAASSGFKGQADVAKYEKARLLQSKIHVIRADYEKKLKSKDKQQAQLGTAMWVIDRLALRVGNEKNDEDEADTVGCCSLRVEHVKLDYKEETITLDFLGKDSMRHFQEYKVVEQYKEVGKRVFENFHKFVKNKKPSHEVFDKLDVGFLNDHLKTLMPGLSAKVFRTMNASVTLQEQLPEYIDPLLTDQEKVKVYNDANREVAILCNHQRTVSSAAQGNLEKLAEYIKLLKSQREELKSMAKKRAKGKEIALRPDLPEDANKDDKKKVAHLFQRQPKEEDVAKRVEAWTKKIKTQEIQLKIKDDNKSVALGTSKINYMDPRITVAFCKRNELPIERVFATALRDKFPWAMSVDPHYSFYLPSSKTK